MDGSYATFLAVEKEKISLVSISGRAQDVFLRAVSERLLLSQSRCFLRSFLVCHEPISPTLSPMTPPKRPRSAGPNGRTLFSRASRLPSGCFAPFIFSTGPKSCGTPSHGANIFIRRHRPRVALLRSRTERCPMKGRSLRCRPKRARQDRIALEIHLRAREN